MRTEQSFDMTLVDFQAAVKDEKQWLVEQLEHTASWHEFRQQRYPHDEDAAGCAQALHELAALIKSLPLTHPLFLKLAEINHLYWQESDVAGLGKWLNETRCVLMQVCFSSSETPRTMIERLVKFTDDAQMAVSSKSLA